VAATCHFVEFASGVPLQLNWRLVHFRFESVFFSLKKLKSTTRKVRKKISLSTIGLIFFCLFLLYNPLKWLLLRQFLEIGGSWSNDLIHFFPISETFFFKIGAQSIVFMK